MATVSSTAAPIRELGYAEITANATDNDGTYTDVAGLSVTVTVGTRPIIVIFDCCSFSNNTANGGAKVQILEDATVLGGVTHFGVDANDGAPIHREFRRAPAAGTYTYKAQLKTLFAGIATLAAGPVGADVGPTFIRVVEF